MRYSRERFDSLIYNPYDVDEDEVKDEAFIGTLRFSLEGIRDVKPPKMVGKTVKYLLFMYDKSSPLRKIETDIQARKVKAAELSEFDLIQDASYLQDLYSLKVEGLRLVLINFIRFQNSREWAALITNEELLWETLSGILRQGGEFRDGKQFLEAIDVKTKLSEKANKIMEQIANYESLLFAGDQNAKEAALEIRSGTTPEAMAALDV